MRLGGTIYTAVSEGYDKGPLGFEPEPEVAREVRLSGLKGREAVLWNREHKLVKPPQTGLWSCYLDGSLSPKVPLRELVCGWLDKAEVALFKHPQRTCAYAEIDACVVRNKITPKEGDQCRAHLQLAGFPRDFGLWALGMIARRVHANALQIFVMPMVWNFVQDVPRDQIWFPYVVWKIKHSLDRIHTIDANIFDNPYFKFKRHA